MNNTSTVDHWRAIRTSSMLTRLFRRQFQKSLLSATPERVLKLLALHRIRCVLIGIVGTSGWRSQPRASGDVDVLVAQRSFKRATHVLKQAFPRLRQGGHEGRATLLFGRDRSEVIDIWTPYTPLLREVFTTSVVVRENVRIPCLEAALATKYASVLREHREMSSRFLDAGDLGDMFMENRKHLDVARLERLADLVREHGGKRLLRWLEKLNAGTGRLELPN